MASPPPRRFPITAAAGTLNLNLGLPWVALLDGFAGGCGSCVTGADGNYQLSVNFGGVPVGAAFSAQFVINNPAAPWSSVAPQ